MNWFPCVFTRVPRIENKARQHDEKEDGRYYNKHTRPRIWVLSWAKKRIEDIDADVE